MRLYKMLAPLFLLATYPAVAAEPVDTFHFVGLYGFTWEGVALAAAELEIEQDKDSYKVHLVIDSRGLVNLFTHHKSDTTAQGRREDGHYLPQRFESHYWTKKKPRHLLLVYNNKGAIVQETVEPPEDPKERPVVPHAQKDGTLDPISGFMAISMGEQTVRVFDAKRLWEGRAVPMPVKKPLGVNGREVKGYFLSRAPLAGMTDKEIRDYAKGEPPLNVFFTTDGPRVPLLLSMPIMLGHLEGRLVRQCKAWDECRIN